MRRSATVPPPRSPITLANDDGDPGTQALWAAHRARLEREVEAIRVSPPSPGMAARDPYALRFGVAMLAFAAAVVAGPEMYGRFVAAFDWRSDEAIAAVAESRIDAWIDPPPYAGQPPLVIDFKTADPQTLTVPEDSVLVVRGDPGVVETRVEGGITPSEQKNETQAAAASGEKSTAPAKAPPGRPARERCGCERRSDRKAVGDPWVRQGDDPARRPTRGGRRPRRHAGRQSDDRLDRGPARQPQRHADARLQDARSIWARQRSGGLLSPARGSRSCPAYTGAAAAGGPATAADRQWRRRRAYDRRSLGAPLGGREGDDAADRRQHFGQDGRERRRSK